MVQAPVQLEIIMAKYAVKLEGKQFATNDAEKLLAAMNMGVQLTIMVVKNQAVRQRLFDIGRDQVLGLPPAIPTEN